jgi:hypothetical protein
MVNSSSAGGGGASGGNGSGVMTREQFKAYGAQLRDKTALYKRYVRTSITVVLTVLLIPLTSGGGVSSVRVSLAITTALD